MAEYINLDNALERLLFSMYGTGYQYEARHAISSMPTIDIVFCKDCKYAKCGYGNDKLGNETFLCYFLAEEGIKMFADNFCSYGERKEFYNGKD